MIAAAPPRFLDAGETALVVEFGAAIDHALTAQVIALDAALARDPVAGIAETVPTYRSLMIHYDPLVLSRAALIDHVARLLPGGTGAPADLGRLWRVPACYDADFAEDMAHVADVTGLTPGEVIRLHATARYRVAMYGFAPGWAYLSGLPAALRLPRRTSPRAMIPARSLIIAGGQAIVAGGAMPSGWHIIGRTPERLFAADRDPPVRIAVGDRLTFDIVDRAAFDALNARAAKGESVAAAGDAP